MVCRVDGKMKGKFIVALAAIIGVTSIVTALIFNGKDTYLAATGVGVIGTIAGYAFGKRVN